MNNIVPKTNRASEVIYQIYPASFNDANGDGHGDLKGITEKLDYIKSLNVDAIWISPFFLTPEGDKGDGGYAISDYQKVDPRFGTNEDFDELIKKAHEKGLRVYTDFVMCHTSDEHEWFQKSVNREAGFENLYVWADGKKDAQGKPILVDGKPVPPNNWKSVFEGSGDRKDKSAWEYNEQRGQFYLHHFNVSQPAINANIKEGQDAVIGEMRKILDRGVDGLRLDAVSFANYDPELRDNPAGWGMDGSTFDSQYLQHSMCQDSTVQYLKRIRTELLDSYDPPKVALGEAIAGKDGGYNAMPISSAYVDEKTGLHSCYTEPKFWPDKDNGKMSGYPSAGELKDHLDNIEKYFPNGSMCNYLSNHDFSRAATRMLPHGCAEDTRITILKQLAEINFFLPGSVCMYQGEELGLPDARIPEDISEDKIKDRLDKKCRDRARAPIPHDNTKKNAGFSESDNPYLPMPDSYKARAVNLQDGNRLSMLTFFRNLIEERQNNPAMRIGATHRLKTPEPIFAFTREAEGQTILFVANMSPYTAKFKPCDYLDEETLEKLHIPQDSEMIISAYNFTRRGLRTPEQSTKLSEEELANGHTGKKIFAVDFLLADVFHHSDKIPEIIDEHGWADNHRTSIEKPLHERLMAATNDNQTVTIGGSTLLTMDTLKKLNPENISVDFMGVAGDDKYGAMVKQHIKSSGINLLTPHWPDGVEQETAISHIIKTGSGEILATYVGNEAQALYKTLDDNRNLLESSIAKSDMVYLPGALTEKFGQSFIDEILRLRWDYQKELVLALPIHAKFGDSDPQTFQNLIRSANIVVGNDMEYARIYGVKMSRPSNDEQMKEITDEIQAAFKEDILQNNGMPCPNGQVAFITRGSEPALLVTKDEVINIPVRQVDDVKNLIGSGDVATAAFLDGELRGLTHPQAAKFAMAMAAEKVQQQEESPHLLDAQASRKKVFLRKNMSDVAASYNNEATHNKVTVHYR